MSIAKTPEWLAVGIMLLFLALWAPASVQAKRAGTNAAAKAGAMAVPEKTTTNIEFEPITPSASAVPTQTSTSTSTGEAETTTVTAPSFDPNGLSPDPAGSVRVNNLANLEALLNIIANGVEIFGISSGVPIFLLGFVVLALPDRRKLSALFISLGLVMAIIGLGTPGVINWLVASARDANLFN